MQSFKLLLALALATLLQVATVAVAQDVTSGNSEARVTDLESKISYRVIGGSPASNGAWPWQVALYMRDASGAYNMLCGGSIIDENWVLTAAHCILSNDAARFKVIEGTNQIDRILKPNGRGRAIAVQQVIPHEAYDAKLTRNDIALLRLARRAKSVPVSLSFPESNSLEGSGQTATITGWGLVRSINFDNWTDFETHEKVRPWDPRYFLDQLREADLPIIDCTEAPASWQTQIDHRNICTFVKEGEKKSSCQGDSGGPLVSKDTNGRFKQIGIVSFGGVPCTAGPSVFSRVSAFESWIKTNSGLKFAEPPIDPSPKPPIKPPPSSPSADGDNQAGVSVSIVQGETLKVNQSAQFRVTTVKSGYLVLIDIRPDGKMIQIFPNARSLSTPTGGGRKSNYVEADRGLLVPDPKNPYTGLEFKTEPPYGEGMLVAILSADPLKSVSLPELPKAMEPNETLDFLAGLTTELRQNLEINGVAKPRVWSFATKTYQIVK